MSGSLLWCTGYYTQEFCKQKAAELRQAIKNNDPQYARYKGVRIVDKVVEEGKQYNRIRLMER